MIELNKIYLKDCIEFMKELESEYIQVDNVVTSPPYNNKKDYGPSYNDNKTREEYLNFIDEVGQMLKRILKSDGSFFLNVGNISSDQWIAIDVANVIKKYFVLQNTITWVKSISMEIENQIISRGHYQPVNSPRYLNSCSEPIYHFTKSGNVKLDKLADGLAVPYQDNSNVGRYSDQDKRDRGNVWFIPYETIQKRRNHPSVFPVELPRLCVKLHGYNQNTTVYDPFMGSGTTALACIDLGVNYLGTEINERFFQDSKHQN